MHVRTMIKRLKMSVHIFMKQRGAYLCHLIIIQECLQYIISQHHQIQKFEMGNRLPNPCLHVEESWMLQCSHHDLNENMRRFSINVLFIYLIFKGIIRCFFMCMNALINKAFINLICNKTWEEFLSMCSSCAWSSIIDEVDLSSSAWCSHQQGLHQSHPFDDETQMDCLLSCS